MIIKESEYATCTKCNARRLVSEEKYGCDYCKSPIDIFNERDSVLEVTAFSHDYRSDKFHFCSWSCLFRELPKIKCDYFISLPYLSFDNSTPAVSLDAFWAAIREVAASNGN